MSWKDDFSADELSRIEFCCLMVAQHKGNSTPNERLIAKLSQIVEKCAPEDVKVGDGQELKLAKMVARALLRLYADVKWGVFDYLLIGHVADEIQVLYGVAETPRKIGHVLRHELGVEIGRRRGEGFPVQMNDEKAEQLRERFGL